MSDSSEAPRLSDTELAEVLALTKDADLVELKLTVPDPERRATVNALGIDALDAQIRQVFFFDTPDLVLNQHGVVVRARRVQRRGDDSVIKLRPVVPNDLPEELRKSKNLVVEVDAMPGGYVCSASMKGPWGPRMSRRYLLAVARSASSTQRNNACSLRPTRPVESASTIWRSSDRSRCSR
jgi:hypothetical protein